MSTNSPGFDRFIGLLTDMDDGAREGGSPHTLFPVRNGPCYNRRQEPFGMLRTDTP